MGLIDPILSEILVCPADHGELTEDVAESRLICDSCGRSYPVREGIPVMLLPNGEGSSEDD